MPVGYAIGVRIAEIADIVSASRRARDGALGGARARAGCSSAAYFGRQAVHSLACRNATRTMSAEGMAHGRLVSVHFARVSRVESDSSGLESWI